MNLVDPQDPADPVAPADRAARDRAMMRRALELADRAAAIGEVPVGAVIYRGDQVIAGGYNRREAQTDPTAHAEVLALREAGRALGTWRLTGCAMAVSLEPCPMCAGALVNSRAARLVYGAADPKMGCVHTLHRLCTDPRFNHRLEVSGGVLAEEAAAALRAFFRARRGAGGPNGPRDTPPAPGLADR